ncbi:MAG TPA: CAP domain-containing protein, partial [Candidatus Saccharimonadales bacterium]|nr:CAP domain-containing protein [Candidatus Saccharimonadales bacterium]
MSHKAQKSIHLLHGFRVASGGLLVLALLVAQFHGWPSLTYDRSSQVLSYATDMSRRDLLDDTNHQRKLAQLPTLTENAKLDASAQAKAEAMVKQDYWAHVAPDGTQPWQYFTKAGYNYTKAGENLAYGFTTADGTVKAWMDSPTHRANLLGDYQDVGFGIASGAHYQGGKYTVVVAHYGMPAKTAAAANSTASPPPVSFGTGQSVNYFSQLSAGNLSAIMLVSLSLCLGAALMFGLTHRKMLSYALETGEHFAVRHPLFDAGLVATVLGLIMISR